MGKGFTLLELLAVMAILALLLALLGGVGSQMHERALRARATMEIAVLASALERYQQDFGDYPDVGQGATEMGAHSALYTANSECYIGTKPQITAPRESAVGTVSGGSGGERLFGCLMGRTGYAALEPVAYAAYLEVQASRVAQGTDGGCYFQDPYGKPYGYYYDAASRSGADGRRKAIFNWVQPDIWSTAGQSEQASVQAADRRAYAVYLQWLKNWSADP